MDGSRWCSRSLRFAAPALALVLLLAFLAPDGARAGVVLDQNHDNVPAPDSFTTGPVDRAQSYTASVTGTLDSVELLINKTGNDRSLIVEIRATLAGPPLGTVNLPPASIPPISNGFLNVDFSSFGIPQVAGTTYFIIMDSGPGSFFSVNLLGTFVGDYYPAGVGYQTATTALPWNAGVADYGFRTYVSTPTVPSLYRPLVGVLALFLIGTTWVMLRGASSATRAAG